MVVDQDKMVDLAQDQVEEEIKMTADMGKNNSVEVALDQDKVTLEVVAGQDNMEMEATMDKVVALEVVVVVVE